MRRGISVKTSVVVFLFFTALTAPGFGYTVLWDTSHGVAAATNNVGGYQPSGFYYDLAYLLREEHGYTVNTTTQGFNADNLADTDVAVVCITSAYNSPYIDDDTEIKTEVDFLADFVRDGGGLLIMGTHPFLNNNAGNSNIQPVANKFGITLAVIGDASDAVSYTPDAIEHPVFAGFTEGDSIFMPAAGEITVDENGFAIVQQPATGPIFIAGANYGSGRVIALGDFNMFSKVPNHFGRVNNADFAVNTFNWLAVPEPATILLMATGFALLRRKR